MYPFLKFTLKQKLFNTLYTQDSDRLYRFTTRNSPVLMINYLDVRVNKSSVDIRGRLFFLDIDAANNKLILDDLL